MCVHSIIPKNRSKRTKTVGVAGTSISWSMRAVACAKVLVAPARKDAQLAEEEETVGLEQMLWVSDR